MGTPLTFIFFPNPSLSPEFESRTHGDNRHGERQGPPMNRACTSSMLSERSHIGTNLHHDRWQDGLTLINVMVGERNLVGLRLVKHA
jgi:hypothetical protein